MKYLIPKTNYKDSIFKSFIYFQFFKRKIKQEVYSLKLMAITLWEYNFFIKLNINIIFIKLNIKYNMSDFTTL